MIDYKISIPPELEEFAKKLEGVSNFEDYISLVLVNPLIKKYEHSKQQIELKKIKKKMHKEICDCKDKIEIKKNKGK